MTHLTEHQAAVLEAIRKAGNEGLSSKSTFRRMSALQISGTVRQLKQKGYFITSEQRHEPAPIGRYAVYRIQHVTAKAKAAEEASGDPTRGVQGVDWDWDFSQGSARKAPIQKGSRQEALL
jgi:hypothetical protein